MIRHTILLLVLLLFTANTWCATNDSSTTIDDIKQIERQIKSPTIDSAGLKQLLSRLAVLNEQAASCVTNVSHEIESLSNELQILGSAAGDETNELLATERKTLTKNKQEAEKKLSVCRLRAARGDELSQEINLLMNAQLAQRLLAQGPTILSLLLDTDTEIIPSINAASTKRIFHNSGIEQLTIVHVVLMLTLLSLAILSGTFLRKSVNTLIRDTVWRENFTACLLKSLLASLAHYAPILLFSMTGALSIFAIYADSGVTYIIESFTYGLFLVVLLNTVFHMLLAPPKTASLCFNIPEPTARSLARRLEILLLLLFIGYLLFSTLLAQNLPENTRLLVRGVFFAILILNLIWVLRLLGDFPRFAIKRKLRLAFQLLLISALIIECLGYRNLSSGILRSILGTVFALGAAILIIRLLDDIADGLQVGRRGWQREIKNMFGFKADEEIPGLFWLRLLSQLCVWVVFLWVVLHILGVSEPALEQISEWVRNGFSVGSLQIVPSRILLALVILTLFLSVNGWFKSQLDHRWLAKARLSYSARETIVTMGGYIVVFIAVLVALSVAGISFTNLAIIAGALSVGIGFGLQNVVNNFVSGLILLFERPIKTGDWIVVGNTEGYVKRIRIRSTLIQTFDRSDVIVPNSELISSQVTNWMLHDVRGRAKIPIGVAYGTDTRKVEQILLSIAREHPSVITDGSSPEPYVLFLRFGDSSLDFELRCHIRNIDDRMRVISDMNYAIDSAFRENHIQIPFPQRDVHIIEQ